MTNCRNRGVGNNLCEGFLAVAPKLGYKASMFNLVFANNAASLRLWYHYGFQEIGRVPKAARLRNSAERVDAIMFFCDFETLRLDEKLRYMTLNVHV